MIFHLALEAASDVWSQVYWGVGVDRVGSRAGQGSLIRVGGVVGDRVVGIHFEPHYSRPVGVLGPCAAGVPVLEPALMSSRWVSRLKNSNSGWPLACSPKVIE